MPSNPASRHHPVDALSSPRRAELAAALAMSQPDQREPIALDGVDVSGVLAAAERLGTVGAVVASLDARGLGDQVDANSRAIYESNVFLNALKLAACEDAVGALGDAGVLAFPIKGAAALQELWGDDIGVRSMVDVDLLADLETFHAARGPLREVGFLPREGGTGLTEALSPELMLWRGEGPARVCLEVHRTLVFPGRHTLDTRGLLRRARRRGDGSLGLDPVDNILYLAIHKAMHGYVNDARDLVDGAGWLRREPIDEGALVRRARRFRCCGAAWIYLKRLRDHLNAPVSEALLEALRPCEARARWLKVALPDCAVDLDFQITTNDRRPLLDKALTAVVVNDSPPLELTTMAAAAARRGADAYLAGLPGYRRAVTLAQQVSLRRLEVWDRAGVS